MNWKILEIVICCVKRRLSEQGWLIPPFPPQPVNLPPPKIQFDRLEALSSGSLLGSEEAKATVVNEAGVGHRSKLFMVQAGLPMVIVLVAYDSLPMVACVHKKLTASAGLLWGEGIEICVYHPLHQIRIYTIEPGSQTAVFGVVSVLGRGAQNAGSTPNLEKVSTKDYQETFAWDHV